MPKQADKGRQVPWWAHIFTVVLVVGVLGGCSYGLSTLNGPGTKTQNVSRAALLRYRGVTTVLGNELVGAKIVEVGKTSSSGTLVLGTGRISSSSENGPAIL